MILNKYYKKIISLFKRDINCFFFFDNLFIEATNVKCLNYSFFDFGFKYLIRMTRLFFNKNRLKCKIIALETLFDETKIELSIYNSNKTGKKTWYILKKAFETRSFLICKLLNPIKNGFAIGFCGVVGYIPKKHIFFDKNLALVSSVFIIVSLDLLKKVFYVSQKLIGKLTLRSLYKLKSKINYTLKK